MYLLAHVVWVSQAFGRRKPRDGVLRKAAYRRHAEDQEEVE